MKPKRKSCGKSCVQSLPGKDALKKFVEKSMALKKERKMFALKSFSENKLKIEAENQKLRRNGNWLRCLLNLMCATSS